MSDKDEGETNNQVVQEDAQEQQATDEAVTEQAVADAGPAQINNEGGNTEQGQEDATDNAAADEQQPGDQPVDEQTADNQPTEEQTADDQPAVEQTADEQQADEQTADEQAQEQVAQSTSAEAAADESDEQPQSKPEIETETEAPENQETSQETVDQAEEADTTPGPPPATAKEPSGPEAEPPGQGRVAASTTPVPTDQQFDVDPHAVTPRAIAPSMDMCTVKFRLMPGQQVHTERCALSQTLLDLKQQLSSELKVPVNMIILTKDGKETGDSQTLPDLGVVPNKTVDLEIMSADPVNYPIKSFKRRQEYQMPDVITVRVVTETNEEKDVVVEIERATCKKPFLGGYKHKKNGVEYHHASAQTMQKPRPPPSVERFCRDTQTTEQKHQVQQTFNQTNTQMTKIGVYVSNMPDRLIVPGPYSTADEHKRKIFNKVLTIQKYYRRWLAKRYVEKVRIDKAKRLEWEREQELLKKMEKEDRIQREFNRRMNPKTKEDFDLLYHALEKWRQEELERINAELTGAERKAALCQLLDQETQLIASIGRHKNEADVENRSKTIQQFLEKAASPNKWKGRDGKITEMDTPYTIRAQELKDIYNSINMKYLTQDERLDVLLTLKHTVKEHDCKLTQEIIELIDREADLLMRGVKETNLEGLRRRISTLFLQYIKTPTFNPEAARLLKVPQDPSVLRKDIYFCQSCNQYKPSTEFQLTSNSSSVGRCRKCDKVDNDARMRQDYSHYRFMLKTLRRAEEEYGDSSQIAFLLQEGDLRYLVENVWNSQSVLSAWDDLYDLVLVRWDKHGEWSPWNCILLTKEEAAAHAKLHKLEESYGRPLVHKVRHKHTLARNYFSRIPGMAEFMRSYADGTKILQGPSVSGKGLGSRKPQEQVVQ